MQKLFILVVILFLGSQLQTAFAQTTVGLKIEQFIDISHSELQLIRSNEGELSSLEYLKTENKLSYGLSIRNQVKSAFVMIDFMYMKRQSVFRNVSNSESIQSTGIYNVESESMSSTIIGGLRIKERFKFGVGPTFSYAYKEKDALKTVLPDSNERLIQTEFNFIFGLDITKNLQVNVGYKRNLSKVADRYASHQFSRKFKGHANSLSVSVAVYL